MPPTPREHAPVNWWAVVGYAVFNTFSIWVCVVLALFVGYPWGGSDDKAARIGAQLEKVVLHREGVIVFAIYSLISIGIHTAFWRALIGNSTDRSPFTLRQVAYAVATHAALFVSAHVIALMAV